MDKEYSFNKYTKENNHIEVVLKPTNISYDDIHALLWKANEQNRLKGFVLKTSLIEGNEIKERIGNKGRCFVAMRNGEMIGTASFRIVHRNKWYAKGEVLDYILLGVLPEYQGMHISSLLFHAIEQYARENCFSIIELDTAENNDKAIESYLHYGFHFVDYKHFKDTDHFSVVMAYWINNQKIPKIFSYMYFFLKRVYIKAKYKLKEGV